MGTKQVVTIIPIAFVVYLFGTTAYGDTVTLPEARTLVAWAILFFVMVALADFDTTSEIANALAWLILLSIVLTYGVGAIERLVGKASTPNKVVNTPIPS